MAVASGRVSGSQVFPPSVVVKTRPVVYVMSTPTAQQRDAVGHDTLWKSPAAGCPVDQVRPPSVVLAMEPSKCGLSLLVAIEHRSRVGQEMSVRLA